MQTVFRIRTYRKIIAGVGFALLLLGAHFAMADTVATFNFKLGKMANYGASPWYTDELFAGGSPMKFNFDTGANFMWATSDLCKTDACNTHQKVNTVQPDFHWLDKTTTARSFGPWGTMYTWTGEVPFNSRKAPSVTFPFFASVKYTGDKFKYLAWGGGMGFPSESDQVERGSGFFFQSLYASGAISQPVFSVVTYPESKKGFFYLGGENPKQFEESSKIELQPKKGSVGYLWGTNLYLAQLGDTVLPTLTGTTYFLDTGSSEFKGDGVYLTPILLALHKLVDKNGQPIFEPIMSDNQMIGLVYANGGKPSMYKDILPDFTLTIGQRCGGSSGQAAKISLDAAQYSYRVEEGQYKNRWVVAFTVLDGVGGLLVGSTFMDHFYTTFHYNAGADKKLTQGNMYLYLAKNGKGPAALSCVPVEPPPPPSNPIIGRWHNSYCSQVDFAASPSGEISGVYTSHTGSTGSSLVAGWLGKPAASTSAAYYGGLPTNPNGTPVALGIQWRLINQDIKAMDNSWRWVSTFSGQYFPAQIVSQPGQNLYYQSETLELLNGLDATATLPGLADTAPVMWPQTLLFSRKAPDYCIAAKPEPAVPYHATANDHVSGKWIDPDGNTLDLSVNMAGDNQIPPGSVTGIYTAKANSAQYTITGLVDTIKADSADVAEQGVTLSMLSKTTQAVISMAGGVSLTDTNKMELWVDTLTSSNWSGRFAESALNKTVWIRD